ncbi:aminobenzoyl-glutamate utilization protein A [Gammaproteobacteria bacterium]|nr:aminobenzoyl-glutamate utilization protein A [Gammaproteobacteria bacterium]
MFDLNNFNQESASLIQELQKHVGEITAIRRFFHQHPELSRQEFKTADKIAALLESWNIKVTRNIGGTGLVGVITKGLSSKMIGIRADMDALPIDEATHKDYASVNQGVMHACGHDGHMAMLLLAAKYLSLEATFDGSIVLIFQPDEEDDAGARRMIEDGLFDKFPVDCVFGMHNYPNAPIGQVMISHGPQMAGTIGLEITVTGLGCHAAHAYNGIDSILVAAHIVVGLQTIVARNLPAQDAGVITIASIHAGKANNVIPQSVEMIGTIRYFDPKTAAIMEEKVKSVAQGIAAAFGASADVRLKHGYIATVNHTEQADFCIKTAQKLLKPEAICLTKKPSMGAEDFAFMLAAKPGCYLFIGNGPGDGGCTLHNPAFDFNDANILVGGAFWTQLTLDYLA